MLHMPINIHGTVQYPPSPAVWCNLIWPGAGPDWRLQLCSTVFLITSSRQAVPSLDCYLTQFTTARHCVPNLLNTPQCREDIFLGFCVQRNSIQVGSILNIWHELLQGGAGGPGGGGAGPGLTAAGPHRSRPTKWTRWEERKDRSTINIVCSTKQTAL